MFQIYLVIFRNYLGMTPVYFQQCSHNGRREALAAAPFVANDVAEYFCNSE